MDTITVSTGSQMEIRSLDGAPVPDPHALKLDKLVMIVSSYVRAGDPANVAHRCTMAHAAIAQYRQCFVQDMPVTARR